MCIPVQSSVYTFGTEIDIKLFTLFTAANDKHHWTSHIFADISIVIMKYTLIKWHILSRINRCSSLRSYPSEWLNYSILCFQCLYMISMITNCEIQLDNKNPKYLYGLSLIGWLALFCIANNRHGVTITTHAIKYHFLVWITTVKQLTKRWCSGVLTLKCTFICVHRWMRQRRIHNTLIVVDRYLRLMGDKTIPDSAEPRLESFYPTFVPGIDLPHQGVVDSYILHQGISYSSNTISLYCGYTCMHMFRLLSQGTWVVVLATSFTPSFMTREDLVSWFTPSASYSWPSAAYG